MKFERGRQDKEEQHKRRRFPIHVRIWVTSWLIPYTFIYCYRDEGIFPWAVTLHILSCKAQRF